MDNFIRVPVELGARSYDIRIGSGLVSQLGQNLKDLTRQSRVFVVSDDVVWGLHGRVCRQSLSEAGLTLHDFVLPAGEASKSWAHLGELLDWLLECGANRDDVIVAFGGGVIGDLTGLAASLMKRGMSLVQVPTTLLAQVDSSVGGKTAINTGHGKNLIGAFYQPRLVLADIGLLHSLPDRQRRAGYAEIVKYGLIDDPEFFDWLESHGDKVLNLQADYISHAVAVSCQAKARIVAADEREGGVRALLNLGHTFGHALEAANGYGPDLLHGEAVGTGMALALRYSHRLGLMSMADCIRADQVLAGGGLETDVSKLSGGPYRAADLVAAMKQDKKVRSGHVPLILSKGLGMAFILPDADLKDVQQFLSEELQGR